jgi:hypothetical protein
MVLRDNVTFTCNCTFCFQMSPLEIFVHSLFIKQDNAESRFLKWIKLWKIIKEALLSALGLKVRLKLLVIEDHRSYMPRSESQWYMVGNKDFAAVYLWLPVLRQLWRNNAAHAPNTCTDSCNESSDRSAGIAASYFHVCNEISVNNKINKCICMKYVSSRN